VQDDVARDIDTSLSLIGVVAAQFPGATDADTYIRCMPPHPEFPDGKELILRLDPVTALMTLVRLRLVINPYTCRPLHALAHCDEWVDAMVNHGDVPLHLRAPQGFLGHRMRTLRFLYAALNELRQRFGVQYVLSTPFGFSGDRYGQYASEYIVRRRG
jgi:hypothetical protein